MNKFMKRLAKNEGFTLVELIVVIAIIAILSGVAVAGYSGYIQNANKAADTAKLEDIETAMLAALAMKGKDSTDATNYFTLTFNATKSELTVAQKAYDSDAAKPADYDDVWANFGNFYGGANPVVLDYYENTKSTADDKTVPVVAGVTVTAPAAAG